MRPRLGSVSARHVQLPRGTKFLDHAWLAETSDLKSADGSDGGRQRTCLARRLIGGRSGAMVTLGRSCVDAYRGVLHVCAHSETDLAERAC